MKFTIYPLFLTLFVLFSCSGNKAKDADSKVSYTTKYAKYFNVVEHGQFTELQIINPDNGQVEKKYALLKNGIQIKLQADFIPIQVPIKSLVALNGTDIGMLEKLNLADKIVGISDMKYIHNATVKKNFKANKVREIHGFSEMNPETVAQLSSVISYSGFGKAPVNEEKLDKLGVICIPNYDWREIHPLGKAEWMKVFALLFCKEEKAKTYLSKIEKEFHALEKEAQKFKTKSTIISGCMIGDYWYMPSGNSYNAFLFRKAKGDFVGKDKFEKNGGSQTCTLEEVMIKYQKTDFWVNPGFKSKKELLTANQKYQYMEAFKRNRIYCYSHDMNYFWEMSAIEPQKVLSDFIQILHPTETSKKNLYFYRQISE